MRLFFVSQIGGPRVCGPKSVQFGPLICETKKVSHNLCQLCETQNKVYPFEGIIHVISLGRSIDPHNRWINGQ